jgi:hypothetical protein
VAWLSGGAIDILLVLLPGFVAAGVFHSLTSHPRPSDFGLVAQSLIFAAIVQTVTELIGLVAPVHELWADSFAGSGIVVQVGVALVFGLILAIVSNHDVAHSILRWLRVTKENAYPSEWYSAFYRNGDSYVVLHLDGERRLFGWPEEWPGSPDKGHFRISEAEWLVDDGRIPLDGVATTLVPATDVSMVEFVRMDSGSQ